MTKKITTDQKNRKNGENYDGSYKPRGSQIHPRKQPPKERSSGGGKGKKK